LWQRLIEHLRQDPDSRRAVIELFDNERSLESHSKDTSCACTLQFLIRNGVLDLIVYMRSNDLVWGLPYDVFNFTMFQELLSCELHVPLGSYFHVAGSLHLYHRHEPLARRVLSNPNGLADFTMPPMPSGDVREQLAEFLRRESALRTNDPAPETRQTLNAYWTDLLDVIQWHRHAVSHGVEQTLGLLPRHNRYSPLVETLLNRRARYILPKLF
jgi:thymidylate synthase